MTNEELVQQIQQGINPGENMEMLYIQNKGFIASLIKRYGYVYYCPHDSVSIIEKEELMHEAYFGLVEAVKRYDPTQGALFTTYAGIWIDQAVKRFIDNSGRVVRVPVYKQQEIYRYNRARAHYLRNYNREPSLREYASWIGISPAGVEKLEQFMFQGEVRSLDEMVPGGENENLSFADVIPAEVDVEEAATAEIAKVQLWEAVGEVLKDDKMRKVIQYRFVEGISLDGIGIQLGITREKVRQYESRALRRLRCNSRTKHLIDYLIA